MTRNRFKSLSLFRRCGITALSSVMVLSLGLAAACSSDDDDSESTTTAVDTQTIANGNFEFFDTGDDDAHIINDADDWSSGYNYASNSVMNGIIDTSEEAWETLTDPSLGLTLANNNVLSSSDDDYVDYNDMTASDIPYKDTYNAISEDTGYYTIFSDDGGYYIYTNEYEAIIEEDEDELDALTKQYVTADTTESGKYTYTNSDNETVTVYAKTVIDNPYTHNYVYNITDNGDGTATGYKSANSTSDSDKVTLYVDDDGNYYLDKDMTQEYGTHVLMLHNYVNGSERWGNEQYYTSSTTIELDANTAAVFSVWVKTSDLVYGRNGDSVTANSNSDGNLGAYISVEQTVNSTTIGEFSITGINTAGVTENNGWVQYTVYLRATDFASTSFTITLGLGKSEDDEARYTVEGYAFFDDIECTIYPTIEDCVEDNNDFSNSGTTLDTTTTATSASDFISKLKSGKTYCSLDDLLQESGNTSKDYTGKEFNTYQWYTISNSSSKTTSSTSSTDNSNNWLDYRTYYIDLSDYDSGSNVPQLVDLTTTQCPPSTVSSYNSGTSTSPVTVTVGFTEDDDGYVTSSKFKGQTCGVNVTSPSISSTGSSSGSDGSSTRLNSDLNIGTSGDVVAAFTISDFISSYSTQNYSTNYKSQLGNYADTIYKLFKDDDAGFDFTKDIPDADSSSNVKSTALVIVSEGGAAYTATIKDSASFKVTAGGYMVVSFWVKTSDMTNFTAATINIVSEEDDEIISTLTVDSTDVTVDVGDYEDIYNGWVQCFFYVENPTEKDKTFYLEFCFGNTTIKDTSLSDYMGGYVAIANIITHTVSEEVYNLTSTGDYAASFSFEGTDNRENAYMDSVKSTASSDIKTNITNSASSYNGVYGGSANTTYQESTDSNGYGARNSSSSAGLINADYFEDYVKSLITGGESSESAYYWLHLLIKYYHAVNGISAVANASDIWNSIFGSASIQPLLIVNTLQYFDSSGVYAMNYGYIASSSTTVSSSDYLAISVRVFVSNGAVAYVYLTEDTTTISSFSLPKYSFWYDNVGNVLDSEPDEDDETYDYSAHIVYYLRDDGLYENKDGTQLYANLYNYVKYYYDSSIVYYDESGNGWSLDEIDNYSDTTYYLDKDKTTIAPHYLGYYDEDETDSFKKIFEYGDCNGTGEYGYYYIVYGTDKKGNTTKSYTGVVNNFVIGSENGGADLRYDNSSNSQELSVCIDARYDSSGKLFGSKSTNYTIGSSSTGSAVSTSSVSQGNELSDADVSNLGYDASGNKTGGKWTTVTFYVQTGDEDKTYYLELWSGDRYSSGATASTVAVTVSSNGTLSTDSNSTSTTVTTDSVLGSFVAFDYSAIETDVEDTFDDLRSEYEDKIIDSYVRLLYAYGTSKSNSDILSAVKSADENISYYEKLFKQYESEIISWLNNGGSSYKYLYKILTSYTALYYTYSLYDDENYVPFNADTAEDGVVGYSYDISDYEETLVYLSYYDFSDTVIGEGTVCVFLDYSAVNVTVDSDEVDDDDDDDDTDDDSDVTTWLLITSIILSAVLIFTLISIIGRDLWKRSRRKRKLANNVYSGKRRHFIRKLKLADGTESVDGTEGVEGAESVDGAEGTEGVDGADGVEGAEGVDGTEGVEGAEGVDGAEGEEPSKSSSPTIDDSADNADDEDDEEK